MLRNSFCGSSGVSLPPRYSAYEGAVRTTAMVLLIIGTAASFSWLMAFLQAQGNIEPEEMARTFNCGIGMAIVVSKDDASEVRQALEDTGETLFEIGRIEHGAKGCTVAGSAGSWSARADWTATHHG